MKFPRATRCIAVATLVIGTFGSATSHVLADSPRESSREIVRFADLNLSTEAGVKSLYARIENAARTVCEPSATTGTRVVSKVWKDCFNEAVRGTILAVKNPALTAYYADRIATASVRTSG